MSELTEQIGQLLEEARQYDSCMSLTVDPESGSVELILDTAGGRTYTEWLAGEGGDMGIHREIGTERAVGFRLPLRNIRLAVFHEGPLRVNCGFKKGEPE